MPALIIQLDIIQSRADISRGGKGSNNMEQFCQRLNCVARLPPFTPILYLECDREPGHEGKHKGVIEGYNGDFEYYEVEWVVTGKPQPADNSAKG